MDRLGLIAGSGDLPLKVARGASRQGMEVFAFALPGETSQELEEEARKVFWVTPMGIPSILEKISTEKITQLTSIGGIDKMKWLKTLDLKGLENQGDSNLLHQIKNIIVSQGIRILDPTEFLDAPPVQEGNITGTSLTPDQQSDIEFGFKMARALGPLDIGQTLVVKDKVVLAVEGIEGTDEAIRRGAKYGGQGVVAIKVTKPGQDLMFDRPVVGKKTIKVLLEAQAAVLAVEAMKVLFVDFQESIELARKGGLSVIAREL